MGGNALKSVETKRLSKDEHHTRLSGKLLGEFIRRCKSTLGETFEQRALNSTNEEIET